MDAIAVLKEQHQKVRMLFRRCEQLGETDPQALQQTVKELCQNLTIHDKIEREIFYPRLLADAENKELVLEGCEEHHLMAILLKQLAEIDADDETYRAKVTVLQEVVMHHIEEEENRMFPQASKFLEGTTLDQLGTQLQTTTERLKGQEPQVTITMLGEVGVETPAIEASR